MDEFLKAVTPALATFLTVVVTALLAWMTKTLNCWAAKQNRVADMTILHSAVNTAVANAREKYGPNATTDQLSGYVVDYAYRSIPDTMRDLNPPGDVLAKLAVAKAAEQKGKANAYDPRLYPTRGLPGRVSDAGGSGTVANNQRGDERPA